MTATTGRGPIKALVVVTYLAMITMNVLANALPLNGRNTGEVSDAYPSLFTPAGITFSIWSVIYLLLGLHVLYQLGLFREDAPDVGRTPFSIGSECCSRSPRWPTPPGCSPGITTSSRCRPS